MHAQRLLRALTIAACLCAAASAARASKPHQRQGLFLGFGFGGGPATWDWVDPDYGGGPSEWAGTLNVRLGGALRDDVVLGAEFTGWARRWTLVSSGGVDLGRTTVSLGTLSLAATYFPGNVGAYLRGGVGIASARTESSLGVADGLEISGTSTDTGMGLLGAAGYEVRVTDKFAIGPQVEVTYLVIDGDVIRNPFVFDMSIQFDWYW